MYRFRGQVDFALLARHAQAGVADGAHRARLSVPGLDLEWNATSVTMAASDDLIVLASGRAYFDDDTALRAQSEQASSWMARYRALGDSAAQRAGGSFAVAVVDFARA